MKKTIAIISAIWSILVGVSFYWNLVNAEIKQKAIALQAARSFFNQIVVTRSWNARHGGVYVPVTDETRPNPYLDDPARDIVTHDGQKLTKINPAFMTRQVAEIAAKNEGIRFHITSLNPIRPQNDPTGREKTALEAFEKGVAEVGEFDKSQFFYMAPLKTEKACLKCHAKQGYKEGMIRGGISVTLPFKPGIPLGALLIGHIGIGLFGVLGTIVFGNKLGKAYEEIKRHALIDVLTNIPNRRNFLERLLKEFKLSLRNKYPLSVIMCDIDNFKAYNDTYGHAKGDLCLKEVASVIEKSLKRPGDFCARYGGEEFIVILPDTSPQGAKKVAEEIRTNLEKMNIPHEASSPYGFVSISLGIATADPENPISHEELVSRADTALYVAKDKGKNRVEMFLEAA